MRHLALLLAGGAVWLFLTALPVFADGGPHVQTVNNGSGGITADSCAACHRAHTSKSPTGYLLTDPSPTITGFCRSCHGATGFGAATNVDWGVQYTLARDPVSTPVVLGALRGGGFLSARIGSADGYRNMATPGAETKNAFIPVAATSQTARSAHLALPGSGLTATNVVWGNGGLNSSAYGPTLARSMECTACHNPHGNGNYRILDTEPNPGAVATGQPALVLQSLIMTTRNTTVTPPVYTASVAVPGNYGANNGPDGLPGTPDDFKGVAAILDSPYVAGRQKNYTVIEKAPAVSVNYERTVTAPWNGAVDPAIPQQPASAFLLYTDQLGSYGASPRYGDYLHKFMTYDVDEEPAPAGTSISNFYDGPNGHPNQGGFTGVVGTSGSQGRYSDFPENVPPAGYTGGVASDGKYYQGFGYQMTLWCTQCHTRYLGWNSSRSTNSGDNNFMFRHSTSKYRVCTTCHVAHGSNAVMNVDPNAGTTNSANVPFPDNQVHNLTTASGDSRLLKANNRGICLSCHDPTEAASGPQGTPPAFVP